MCSTVLHTAGLLRDEFIGAVSLDVNEVRHRNMTLFGTVFATAVVRYERRETGVFTFGRTVICLDARVVEPVKVQGWCKKGGTPREASLPCEDPK